MPKILVEINSIFELFLGPSPSRNVWPGWANNSRMTLVEYAGLSICQPAVAAFRPLVGGGCPKRFSFLMRRNFKRTLYCGKPFRRWIHPWLEMMPPFRLSYTCNLSTYYFAHSIDQSIDIFSYFLPRPEGVLLVQVLHLRYSYPSTVILVGPLHRSSRLGCPSKHRKPESPTQKALVGPEHPEALQP